MPGDQGRSPLLTDDVGNRAEGTIAPVIADALGCHGKATTRHRNDPGLGTWRGWATASFASPARPTAAARSGRALANWTTASALPTWLAGNAATPHPPRTLPAAVAPCPARRAPTWTYGTRRSRPRWSGRQPMTSSLARGPPKAG
ncbi:hypothetical protein [Streptomyces eurythermus]